MLQRAISGLLSLAAIAPMMAAEPVPVVERDLFSDTWVATDALGRATPEAAAVGPLRPNKTIGMFYFLWLGQHGEEGPYDIARILEQDPSALQNPASPLWGKLHVPHHWGESIFGYYTGEDEGVLRKHAQMLSDAGVDAIIFDVTNQLTYPRSWGALCRAFDQLRRAGNRVPKIAFLCPFWAPEKVIRELWRDLYRENLHPELWFHWAGKPLIMADPNMLGATTQVDRHDLPVELAVGRTLAQTFTATEPFRAVGGCFPTYHNTTSALTLTMRRGGPEGERLAQKRFDPVADNAWLMLEFTNAWPAGTYLLEASAASGRIGWWTAKGDTYTNGVALSDGRPAEGDRNLRLEFLNDEAAQIRQFFTFRKPQPDYFTGPTGPGQWGWLEVYPQHGFYQTPGVPEQVAVGVAQNALDGKLSVLSNPRAHGRSFHDGRQPGPEGQDFTGRNFAEQWRRAREIDPPFVFITGWNEWIAGRFTLKSGFYGDGPVTFVDQFSREYSRDIEPMKGGHGDAYYYQLVSEVRRFKGARPVPEIKPGKIAMEGRFEDWAPIEPEFRDTASDPVQRDARGWGQGTRYVNQTGRNDLLAAKVAYDARNIYFYVRTREKLTAPTNQNWMVLFLDTDANPTNGWLGYDFVINRQREGISGTTVERFAGPGYAWQRAGRGTWCGGRQEIEIAIPRRELGWDRQLPAHLDFKWADNLQQTGDWSDFTLNGDAAPNERFNYRAKFAK